VQFITHKVKFTKEINGKNGIQITVTLDQKANTEENDSFASNAEFNIPTPHKRERSRSNSRHSRASSQTRCQKSTSISIQCETRQKKPRSFAEFTTQLQAFYNANPIATFSSISNELRHEIKMQMMNEEIDNYVVSDEYHAYRESLKHVTAVADLPCQNVVNEEDVRCLIDSAIDISNNQSGTKNNEEFNGLQPKQTEKTELSQCFKSTRERAKSVGYGQHTRVKIDVDDFVVLMERGLTRAISNTEFRGRDRADLEACVEG